MKVFYGQKGQPVGSIASDAVFDKAGEPIGQIFQNHIYRYRSGERIGCLAGGVIYNASGAPQAFSEGCRKALFLVEPRLTPMSPRLLPRGENVSDLPAMPIPNFLREDSLVNDRNPLLDGRFA